MRRIPLLLLPAALLLALLIPSSASAALRIGISDSSPTMFTDPLFAPLQIKQTRLMVSYNALSVNDDERTRVTQYIEAASVAGIDVLVTFQHARGNSAQCRTRRAKRLAQCKLPSVAEYSAEFSKFRERFPQITSFSPWNEINHASQPTYKNPKRAAQFTKVVAQKCVGCTIVVADLLDQADSTKRKKATFKNTTRYIRKFKKELAKRGVPRKICGIHNYSDTNRFRTSGTRALMKALACKQYWLTETGGITKFAGFKYSTKRQHKATKYMFKIARKYKRIKRLYVHNYFGVGRGGRFDAGITFQGKPRPAYREVKKRTTGAA